MLSQVLSPIQADLSLPQIPFVHQGHSINLIGLKPKPPTPTTLPKICNFLHTDSIASFHLLNISHSQPCDLSSFSTPTTNFSPTHIDPHINNLFTHFTPIFSQSQDLALNTPHNHHLSYSYLTMNWLISTLTSTPISYCSDKHNQVNDAFSHIPELVALLFIVSSLVPDMFQKLKEYYVHDDDRRKLVQSYVTNSESPTPFHFSKGFLFLKDCIFVPHIMTLRHDLIHEFHSTLTIGHFGIKAYVAHLVAFFFWPGLYKDTKQLVRQCLTCQQNKPVNKKMDLLQPLATHLQVQEELTLDFITHLPSSFGHIVIQVIYNRLTKFVHFLALPTHYTTFILAHHFSVDICRLHGVPKIIVFDRHLVFLSHFWKEILQKQAS